MYKTLLIINLLFTNGPSSASNIDRVMNFQCRVVINKPSSFKKPVNIPGNVHHSQIMNINNCYQQ